MNFEDARRWHKQLYEHIWREMSRLSEHGSAPPKSARSLHVGITYDLRSEYLAAGYGDEETAEFDRPDTIDAIADALGQLGHGVDRIGRIHQLVDRLSSGDRWDLVFNISEGLHGTARESQVPAVLDAFQTAYTFSDPLVTAVCLDKGLTKLLVGDAGLPTPRHLLVRSLTDLDRIDLGFPLFTKPVAEGTGKGVNAQSRVEDTAHLRENCRHLLERFRQPVLVEEYLPGREFTVGLVGTGDQAQVLGTLEIRLRKGAESGAYSYVNKEECESLIDYPLVLADNDPAVREAETIAWAAWRHLGCRDAGRIDLRCDAEGHPQFLEVNPLAGLHPNHSDLPMLCTAIGMRYVDLIDRIVTSAATRIVKPDSRTTAGKQACTS